MPVSKPIRDRSRFPGVIVCERASHWVVALRVELSAAGIPIHQTRSLDQCWQYLAGLPTSVLALELTDVNLPRIIDGLRHLQQYYPSARAVILSRPSLRRVAPLVAEAGAVWTFFSRRELVPIRRLVQRHLASFPEAETGTAEQMVASLPWG